MRKWRTLSLVGDISREVRPAYAARRHKAAKPPRETCFYKYEVLKFPGCKEHVITLKHTGKWIADSHPKG